MTRPSTSCMATLFVLLSAVPTAAADTSESQRGTCLWASSSGPAAEAKERSGSPYTLQSLYGVYAVMQGMDVYSTVLAKQAGAREMNPLMDGGPMRMLGLKVASTTVTYYFVRKIAKKNRKAAVATMVVLNGVAAAVVAHNLNNARR